jgi:hypothetical protein
MLNIIFAKKNVSKWVMVWVFNVMFSFCQVFNVNTLLLSYLRVSNFMCITVIQHDTTK